MWEDYGWYQIENLKVCVKAMGWRRDPSLSATPSASLLLFLALTLLLSHHHCKDPVIISATIHVISLFDFCQFCCNAVYLVKCLDFEASSYAWLSKVKPVLLVIQQYGVSAACQTLHWKLKKQKWLRHNAHKSSKDRKAHKLIIGRQCGDTIVEVCKESHGNI